MKKIEIDAADGPCPAYVFTPKSEGPWPGVLFYMDGIGMRPALHRIAERIAGAGYHVLLPDLFYRLGAYEAPNPKELFADQAMRAAWFKRVSTTTTPEKVMRDTEAFLAHFPHAQRIGITGYCMGGRMALTAAGTFPDRVAAAAAFHPGNVATDVPDSPHLLAPKIRGQIYVAGASDDVTFPDEQKQRLIDALGSAHVEHVVETYPARHGWVPEDTPVHDPALAERHFEALFALFARTL